MAHSKYDYDPKIFNAEPPEKMNLVKKLFCGRQAELERGKPVSDKVRRLKSANE